MAEDPDKTQEHASGKTHGRIDRAADRVKQGTASAAQATRQTTDRAEQRVDEATDAAAQTAHRAADKVADWRECGAAAACTMRDRAESLFEDAREWMRDRPVESVAIALATGWLIGRLLSARR